MDGTQLLLYYHHFVQASGLVPEPNNLNRIDPAAVPPAAPVLGAVPAVGTQAGRTERPLAPVPGGGQLGPQALAVLAQLAGLVLEAVELAPRHGLRVLVLHLGQIALR